jgi:hypothetical protein
MDTSQFSQLLYKNKFYFEEKLSVNLSSNKESMVILETLWTLFVCKMLQKEVYKKTDSNFEMMGILTRKAYDVQWDYFRSKVQSDKTLFRDVHLNNFEIIDLSKPTPKNYEDCDAFNVLYQALITKLSNLDIMILNFCLIEGRANEEVAFLLDKNAALIKKRVFRLREKLKNIIKELRGK